MKSNLQTGKEGARLIHQAVPRVFQPLSEKVHFFGNNLKNGFLRLRRIQRRLDRNTRWECLCFRKHLNRLRVHPNRDRLLVLGRLDIGVEPLSSLFASLGFTLLGELGQLSTRPINCGAEHTLRIDLTKLGFPQLKGHRNAPIGPVGTEPIAVDEPPKLLSHLIALLEEVGRSFLPRVVSGVITHDNLHEKNALQAGEWVPCFLANHHLANIPPSRVGLTTIGSGTTECPSNQSTPFGGVCGVKTRQHYVRCCEYQGTA